MSESKKTVFVVGLGPGGGQFLTVQAQSALQQAEVLCGYTVYIDLVRPLYPEKECYTTGMTREIDRCRWALDTARALADSRPASQNLHEGLMLGTDQTVGRTGFPHVVLAFV